MKLLIKNGRVIDPQNQIDKITDIYISDGKIQHIGTAPVGFQADTTIDATSQWVIPGIVDLCNRPHVKHPHGTTLRHEAQVAVKKGMTTLCIPPDGDRIIDHPNDLIRIQHEDESVPPRLYSIAALTKGLCGEKMTDYSLLKAVGCIALSQAQAPLKNKAFLKSCYSYASSLNIPVIIQPQDYDLSHAGYAHDGVVATRLGLPSISYTAETIAIQEHLALIEETQLKAHFTCISSHQAVELLAQAKQKGLNITADVAMHSLLLTEMDLLEFDGNCHLYPPLRSQSDQLGLLHGIQNQTIDAICSDHRPLDSMAKLAPFGETTPGLSAIDSFLSLGLYLVEQGKLDVMTFVRAITANPARIFDLPEGSLSVGRNANICILNPSQYWTVTTETMLSKGKNSPFKDWQIPGQVTHTLINGQIVFSA